MTAHRLSKNLCPTMAKLPASYFPFQTLPGDVIVGRGGEH